MATRPNNYYNRINRIVNIARIFTESPVSANNRHNIGDEIMTKGYGKRTAAEISPDDAWKSIYRRLTGRQKTGDGSILRSVNTVKTTISSPSTFALRVFCRTCGR